MHKNEEHGHSRKQFQIDRIAFFSDAVIAIALTLMILEVRIPELGADISIREVFARYGGSMLLHGLALLIAFWTIGNLWMRHHALFEGIVNYNEIFVRVNLFFLFTVMLLPISISFLFRNNEPFNFKMFFYFGNLFFASFTFSALLYIVFSPKNRFSSLTDPIKVREIKDNSYLGTAVFLLTMILILLNIKFFWIAFLLIPFSKALFRAKKKAALKKMR